MSQGNKMFRQEALDRLSSPERLDQTLKIVNPRAWLPLATAGSLVLIAVGWSVLGRIPLNVNGQGVLIQPRRVVPVQAPSEGYVVELKIKPGDEIKKGDVLGIVSQSALNQQLEQEKAKLSKLLALSSNSSDLQRKYLNSERQALANKRDNLEESLRRAQIERDLRNKSLESLIQNRRTLENSLSSFQGLVPEIRTKSLDSLAKNRASLNQRLEQIKNLLPSVESRVESYRNLFKEKVITENVLLNAEREYFNSLAQLSQLEAQLKQLDVEETNTQGQYLQNLNQIDEIKAKLKQLDVEEANIQRQYLQSLDRIDELQNNIQQINSQVAKLDREDLETSFDRDSKVQEVRNRIAQLEGEIAQKSRIVSEYDGKVLELAVVSGQIIGTGNRIGTIQARDTDSQLVGVVYFADKDGKKVKPGMSVQITPSIVKRERYGGIVGEVSQVSAFPLTTQDMSSIIGNQNLAEDLVRSLGGKAPVQVFTSLKPNADNVSGYEWSSSDGPPIELSSGTTAQVRVKIGNVAPISYVIPLFRSLTGIY
ncbi:MAG: NHLP bacteriocin system secretion protein [Xenococcaceae cyanobacterium MO_188.B32]|nr:NHLP bacteriocin system secretion protein [Xenococcaceae cyanobacterium MO_188.B32]